LWTVCAPASASSGSRFPCSPETTARSWTATCGYDPCDLVTEHRGRRNEIVGGKEQVGVTQPGRLHVDESFTSNWRGNVHILEVESATECVQYKRLHVCI
jgi:hypothetical protein